MNSNGTDSDENTHENNLDPYHHEPSRRSRRHREKQSAHIYREKESPSFDGSEEFEDGKRRSRIHKPKNSNNWDDSDGGNGKVEHGSESLKVSKYYRKDGQRAERGESKKRYSSHHEKSQRKRGTSDFEAIRSDATDNQIDESNDKRGRWEPGEGDSA